MGSTNNPDPGSGNNPSDPNRDRMFSKAEVDQMMANFRRDLETKMSEELEKAVNLRIEEFKIDNNLDDKTIETLSARLSEADKASLDLKRANKRIEDLELNLSNAQKNLHTHVAKNALYSASQKRNVIDPDIVWSSLGHQIKIGDDGNPIVPDGKTVDKLVEDFLATRDFLIRPSNSSGGSGSGSGQGGNEPPKYDLNTREGRSEALKAELAAMSSDDGK